MAAPTEAQIAHQELIDKLDIHSVHKSFRNPHWKPNQRRNKNIKTILGDASRKEASSIIATPQDPNSGTVTPGGGAGAGGDKDDGLSTSGSSTPVVAATTNNGSGSGIGSAADSLQPNLAQASRSLSKLVLEKNMRQNGAGGGGGGATTASAPSATYTNIESAPSLAHTKRYCDVTGLPAPYLDPKSRLRYHDKEVFAFIR